MDRGVYQDYSEAERVTLGDILERYVREISPSKKAGSIEVIRIRKFLRDESICQYKASLLSGKLISAWRDQRLKHVSGSTVNRELNLLSHAINIARKEWGINISNPIEMIRRPKENRAREHRLSPSEEELLISALSETARAVNGKFRSGTRNNWIKPIVLFALETAMRRSELLSLRWENVNLIKRTALLPDTKNGDSRIVPLSTKAIAILEQLPRSIDGKVFPITPMSLRLAFTRACRRVGISDLHFHDLRHEATSRLAEKLTNILELSAVTGHKDLRMLKRYYHPRAEDLALKLG